MSSEGSGPRRGGGSNGTRPPLPPATPQTRRRKGAPPSPPRRCQASPGPTSLTSSREEPKSKGSGLRGRFSVDRQWFSEPFRGPERSRGCERAGEGGCGEGRREEGDSSGDLGTRSGPAPAVPPARRVRSGSLGSPAPGGGEPGA